MKISKKIYPILLLTLLNYICNLTLAKGLKIQSSHHGKQKQSQQNRQNWTFLEWTWYETQFLLDEAPEIPKDYKINQEQWKYRYSQFFHTPQWLTQQKFQFCDWNGDNMIEASEVRCF